MEERGGAWVGGRDGMDVEEESSRRQTTLGICRWVENDAVKRADREQEEASSWACFAFCVSPGRGRSQRVRVFGNSIHQRTVQSTVHNSPSNLPPRNYHLPSLCRPSPFFQNETRATPTPMKRKCRMRVERRGERAKERKGGGGALAHGGGGLRSLCRPPLTISPTAAGQQRPLGRRSRSGSPWTSSASSSPQTGGEHAAARHWPASRATT